MKTALLIAATLSLALWGQQADPAKVEQVKKGDLKVARASWWGFDKDDATACLQNAISSKVPKLIVDKMTSPWILSKTVNLVSNQEVVFEEGTLLLAKKGAFIPRSQVMMLAHDVKNLTLRGEGKGATFRMLKADYQRPPYQPAEWRHTLSILSGSDILVENLRFEESGGDGVYIAKSNSRPNHPSNITLRRIICDRNHRQGLSVISVIGLLVEDSEFNNTSGTAPEAGIDFEPNTTNEPMKGIVVRNCKALNNNGDGFGAYLWPMNSDAGPIEFTFENCIADGNLDAPFAFTSRNGAGYTTQGYINVKNCRFSNSGKNIRLNNTSHKGYTTTFENVQVENIGRCDMAQPVFSVGYFRNMNTEAAGNIFFKNVSVLDFKPRTLFGVTNLEGSPACGALNISGKIDAILACKPTSLEITPEWLKKRFPARSLEEVAPVPTENFKLVPAFPGKASADKELAGLTIRHIGRYNFYAEAGRKVSFTIYHKRLAHLPDSTARAIIYPPYGGRVVLGTIPMDEERTFTFDKPNVTGIYKLSVEAGQNLSSVKRCSAPLWIDTTPGVNDICTGKGDFYFFVPENTPQFMARFWGEGVEGLKATIFAPDGKQLWSKDDISDLAQFICKGDIAKKGGAFMLRIEKPTNLKTLEDYWILFGGIPQVLSPHKDFLVKPAK